MTLEQMLAEYQAAQERLNESYYQGKPTEDTEHEEKLLYFIEYLLAEYYDYDF